MARDVVGAGAAAAAHDVDGTVAGHAAEHRGACPAGVSS